MIASFKFNFFLTCAFMISSSVQSNGFLEDISKVQDPDEAQKIIRMHVKGDENHCLELFKKAVKQQNYSAQVHIANAHYALHWAKDKEKEFTKFPTFQALESYCFSGRAFEFIEGMNRKLEPDLDWKENERRARIALTQAAQQGNRFAHLVLIRKGHWGGCLNFAAACKLKKLMDQASFPELTGTFGQALLSSGLYNEQLELEGLSYLEESGKLSIDFVDQDPRERSFSDYCSGYVRFENAFDTYYKKYGMMFVGNWKIIVPSKKHWEAFKKEKLDTITASPRELFDLYEQHDIEYIYSLKKKYDLGCVAGATGGNPFLAVFVKGESGCNKLGKIIVDKDDRTIKSTIVLSENEIELAPAIRFAEDAMRRCADGSSVNSMFENLQHYIELAKSKL